MNMQRSHRDISIDMIGGKGAGLFWLSSHQDMGFEVPQFKVLDTSFFAEIERQQTLANIAGTISGKPYKISRLQDSIQREIDAIASQMSADKIVVRSSSIKEDGQNSFAGIYHSEIVEDPTPQKLYDAAVRVYQSFYSPKAIEYRREHGIEGDKMAVVVQKFIEPDYSGVMFTSNPSYPSELSIEFCYARNSVVTGEGETFIHAFDKKTSSVNF